MQAIINVYAPKDLKAKVKKIAKNSGYRSVSAWVCAIVEDEIKKIEAVQAKNA